MFDTGSKWTNAYILSIRFAHSSFAYFYKPMGSKCFFKTLTVGCWNIEGMYEKVNGVKICKLDDPSFIDTLRKFDLLCLQETHLAQDDNIPTLDNFRAVPHCRKKSSNNRYFGGFLLLVRRSIEKGIKINKNKDMLEGYA